MIRATAPRLAEHYFTLAATSMAEARHQWGLAERYAMRREPDLADAFRRMVTSSVRLARAYHRSGLAAKRRAEQP